MASALGYFKLSYVVKKNLSNSVSKLRVINNLIIMIFPQTYSLAVKFVSFQIVISWEMYTTKMGYFY